MLFAVFGSERSACPPLSREAQITVRIDLWTNCLEISHWIVDLLKPGGIKVNINSRRLLFGGRRESSLRDSRGSALAPSTPGRLGYNRGKKLIRYDISALIFSRLARLNCNLAQKIKMLRPIYLQAGSHPPPVSSPLYGPPALPDGREPHSATHPPSDFILIIRRLSLS
jgi:hypothetical protein